MLLNCLWPSLVCPHQADPFLIIKIRISKGSDNPSFSWVQPGFCCFHHYGLSMRKFKNLFRFPFPEASDVQLSLSWLGSSQVPWRTGEQHGE